MRNFLALITVWVLIAGITSAEDRPVNYHKDIAPLLRDYCSGCHNEGDYEGDFSVETFAALMKGGESEDETIIVPGKADESFLMHTLRRQSKPAMPPKKEPQMEKEELALFERWIAEGAKGPALKDDHSLLSTLSVPDIAPKGKVAKSVTAAEYSPAGKYLAVARFGGVDLLDATSKKRLKYFPNQDGLGKVNAVHFSADGKTLVTASGISGLRGVATIWSVDSGKILREIGSEAHRDILFDAEFSPDGLWLATAGYDRVIRLWETATGKFIRDMSGHNGAVFDLAFSPDGKLLASASADETGKIWKLETGKRMSTLNQPQAEQYCITFSKDGKYVLSAGGDNRIRMWRLISREKQRINPIIHSRFGHEDEISGFALSKDGKWLATASADRTVKLWKVPSLEQVKVFGEQPDLVSVLAFATGEKGEFFAGRMDGSSQHYSFNETALLKQKATGYAPVLNPVKSKGVAGELKKVNEAKESKQSQKVSVPVEISGSIAKRDEVDAFRFTAKKGEEWILEVDAARSKSLLDSKVEVVSKDGEPIERVVLQSMRDSWLTFRGRDSDQSDSFRLHNWREMELNEYLYSNGEVTRLWHYPRGPDSGFRVYPGIGKRFSYFGTTALAHPLGENCYIVKPLPPGSDPIPNGLPVFRLIYENDDDPRRQNGADSKLSFIAPAAGEYLARIRDVRGFGGEKFTYKLTIRPPLPDFSFALDKTKEKISPGGRKELRFTTMRHDGFSGEIKIDLKGLPKGYSAGTPLTIQADQERAIMVLNAAADAKAITDDQMKAIKITGKATIKGKEVSRELKGALAKIELGGKPKLLVKLHSDGDSGKVAADGVLEFHLHPGETMKALVKITRKGIEGDIKFGTDDSGRNLPHGVYVDNIGLSGLMVQDKKNEQRLFITAAKWVPKTRRIFHVRTASDGGQLSQSVRLVID